MLSTLVLVAVALAADDGDPAPSAAGGPLAACHATHADQETWVYECAGLDATSTDRTDQVLAGPYLDGVEAGVRARVGGDVTVVRERGRLAGREADLVRIRSGGETKVTAVLASRDGTRVVSCSAPLDRCGPVLETLATVPWRAVAPAAVVRDGAAVELRLGGRPIAVPSGCTQRHTAGGGMIVCGDAQFTAVWGALPDEETAARVTGEFGARIARGVTPLASCAGCSLSAGQVPCRIGGVEASCDRLVATGPAPARPAGPARPHRFVSMRGWTTVAGRPTFAACTADGPEPVPQPCAAVFELR